MKHLSDQSSIHHNIEIMAEIAHAEIRAKCAAYVESSNRSFGQIIRHQVARQLRARAGK